MADYQITLRISETAYERARSIAAQTAQPVEQVLAARIDQAFDAFSALPVDEQTELAAFQQLSDDTLFGIVGEHLSPTLTERMVLLGERVSRGAITPDENTDYAALVERANRLILRKAWAANILMDRGHTISQQDFAPIHE